MNRLQAWIARHRTRDLVEYLSSRKEPISYEGLGQLSRSLHAMVCGSQALVLDLQRTVRIEEMQGILVNDDVRTGRITLEYVATGGERRSREICYGMLPSVAMLSQPELERQFPGLRGYGGALLLSTGKPGGSLALTDREMTLYLPRRK